MWWLKQLIEQDPVEVDDLVDILQSHGMCVRPSIKPRNS